MLVGATCENVFENSKDLYLAAQWDEDEEDGFFCHVIV